MEHFESEAAELESPLDRVTREDAEAATSGHLVRMIDFFFALVLGQGILRFDDVLVSPSTGNLSLWIALLAIYYTVVRSFVGWHAAIEQRRYRILTGNVRTTELWRFYIDVVIAVVYAYMLIAAEPLKADGGADIRNLLWAFPLVFVLYAAWGQLRRVAWGDDDFRLRLLAIFGVLYAGLAVVYSLLDTTARWNVVALLLTFVLMFLYRYINFWQGHDDRRRWAGIPRPRMPRLTALR